MDKKLLGLVVALIFLSACQQSTQKKNVTELSDTSAGKKYLLRPEGIDPVSNISVSNGSLRAVFTDNSRYGEFHRAGYNGIAELWHELQDSSIFVPEYAGFNLEHIFGGDSLPELFEPRVHPMELYPISDNQVLLYQKPTPLSGVESQILFTMREPYYIDVNIRFIIHKDEFFRHGYAGLFWASYIHAPADKNMYFRGRKMNEDSFRWVKAYSEEHGVESTHLAEDHYTDIFFDPAFNARLASNFSDYVYDKPFFYGRFHNMVLIFMFDRSKGIRFSQSPTGGGQFSPAWDFQYIVPDFKTGTEYDFNARMVYKEYQGRADVLEEFEIWKND